MDTRLAKRRYRFGWRLFTGAANWLAIWLAAGLVLVPLAAVLLAEVIETGLWSIAASVLQWFAAATAGTVIHTNLATWISRGCTRREITVAYAVFGALATVALTALVTAGFAVEHALLELAGDASRTWGESVGMGVRYLAITPIYFFAGAFIGVAAARFGGRTWFTAAILFGAAALYAGVLALEFDVLGGGWHLAAWTGVALAVTAVLVAAYALALRSIPISAKRA
jgi:hypothetical protein